MKFSVKRLALSLFSIGVMGGLMGGLVGMPSAYAAPVAKSNSIEELSAPTGFKIQELGTREVTDGKRKYILRELLNHFGTYEVQVILKEDRWLVPDSSRTILIGRAINVPQSLIDPKSPYASNPRRVTAWFIPKSLEVLAPIEYVQTGDDPWPTALSVIQTRINTDNRYYAWVLMETVAPALSMAIAHHEKFFEQIKREQLQLFDLETRANHLELTNPEDPTLPIIRSILAEGWTSINERIKDERTKKYWMYLAGDVVLGATVTKAVGIASTIAGRAAGSLSATSIGKILESSYGTTLKAIGERTSRAIAKLKGGAPVAATTIARVGLAQLTTAQKVSAALSFLQSRSVLARATLNGLKTVGSVAWSGAKEFKYIALAQSMQVVAETAARPDDLFDPNPIVMAKKMANDKDFVQNVAYMTNETFWMAGIARYLGSGFKAYAVAGVVGMVDSIAMSVIVKGEADPKRIALDTGWEAVVGSAQTTLIDARALRFFEGLAERTGNPKLSLLGYVVAFGDQTAGYFTYAKLTHWISNSDKEEVQGPVFQNPALKLIPVLGPM